MTPERQTPRPDPVAFPDDTRPLTHFDVVVTVIFVNLAIFVLIIALGLGIPWLCSQ
jgi:hypothetical protein